MLRGGEAEIQSIAAHNVHENVGRVQEGVMSMLIYVPLVDKYDVKHSGKDDTGIGIWAIMVFKGPEGIKNRINCGYNFCYNKKMDSRSIYRKQHRYLVLKEKDQTCPRKRLYDDLIRQFERL